MSRYEAHKRKKDKGTNNDLQNTTQKTKDRVTGTPPKTRGELGWSERIDSSCSISGTHRVTAVILHMLECCYISNDAYKKYIELTFCYINMMSFH